MLRAVFRLGKFGLCLVLLTWLGESPPAAAARVELEIYTGENASFTAQHEWLRNLAQAGVGNLRFRPRQADDQPRIETRGTREDPAYLVIGALSPGGELVLPGARFRLGETARLARWLEDVGRMGPSFTEKKSVFGLTARQFEQVQKELSQPVGVPTKDCSRREVVEHIARRLASPLRVAGSQLQSLERDTVGVELSGLSCGTALAYVLRPGGLAMAPAAAAGDNVEYRVVESRQGQEIWPIGWEPEKSMQQVLPAMFEFFNANVQGVPVTQVLEVVRQRLAAPVLLDQNALARYDIHPEKTTVNLPPVRTSYNLLLRKVLSPAQLKFEVRVDEADKPFVWITSLRPM